MSLWASGLEMPAEGGPYRLGALGQTHTPGTVACHGAVEPWGAPTQPGRVGAVRGAQQSLVGTAMSAEGRGIGVGVGVGEEGWKEAQGVPAEKPGRGF